MTSSSLNRQWVEDLRNQGLVVFAGAGLSMSAPSSLPDWYRLNQLIFDCLCDRYEAFLDKPDYLVPIRNLVDTSRQQGHFPPDYQAQLLHEHCGDDYFRLLQCVDINITNANHQALARLAASGCVKAIITTNFDRLIETALFEHGVEFNVAFDETTYEQCFARLDVSTDQSVIDVIKIHGCVQNHLTLVDTLKQRLNGRNAFLDRCVSRLLANHFFIYTGFSGLDLESDSDYLGLIDSAAASPGLLFTLWPGSPVPSHGAAALISAYGDKAHTLVAETHSVFNLLLGESGSGSTESPTTPISAPAGAGYDLVEQALAIASQHLSTALVSTCLAAVLEANGQTRSAYNITQTFWRRSANTERAQPGFVRFRLLHGRLGVGLGQISIVSHRNSSRLEDGVQNLLRVRDQDRRADAWAGLALAWWGDVDRGYPLLLSSLSATQATRDSVDHQLDCWFALAEYHFFTREGLDAFDNWAQYLTMAKASGDLARLARVSAMVYLHLCDVTGNVANADQMYQQLFLPRIFARSERLNDPISEGLTALARARWFNHQNNAEQAIPSVETAMQKLSQAGMVRWYDFARIELSKSLMDQGRLEESAELLSRLEDSLADHALLLPRFHSAWADLHHVADNVEQSAASYANAASVCGQLGMLKWQSVYSKAATAVLATA